VFSGVLVAASVSVACLLAYEESKQSLERHLGEHLLAVVNTAAPQLDGDLLARIAAGADGELRGVEEFEELRGILVRVKDANGLQSHGSPLYVLRAAPGYAQDGELEFAVMTDRDANGKYFVGNRYRAEAHNRRALQGQAAATGVYQDAEGSWISAAAPIRDGTGRVVALLQADRPVDFFYAEARRQAVAIFAGGLLCLAVALALAIWLGRSFAEPLERLAEVTGAIAGGRLDTRVALDRNDELGDLGESVNRMAAELEAGRVQLESALEETRKASEAKTEFLATMSHELRTPMNGVMGFAALLLDTGLTALQRHYVQTIDLSANSLLAIINDVLDFSKMDSGKLTVEQVAFSPAVVAEEAAAMLMPAAAAKALRLECQVDPGVSEFILGDPLRFRQVAVNLLGNGIKFTSRGFVRIRLRQRDGDGGPLLRVEVEDTGIGIDTATQARLFRPFVQADSSTTRRYGGTGLGLAISRRLVELMAGSIGVESATGKGSRFW
jgi:signal transduction histidine kinase